MPPPDVALSKRLSLVLRHDPASVGLTLDEGGWVGVPQLLAAFAAAGQPLDRPTLERLVATSDKQRFALSPDGSRIRANQGHSVEVNLGLSPARPPPLLYHGTVARFLASILAEGLRKGARQHVHLSADVATATKVGARRGRPVVLEVDAPAVAAAGHTFYRSDNGVWLVDHVPPPCLRVMDP